MKKKERLEREEAEKLRRREAIAAERERGGVANISAFLRPPCKICRPAPAQRAQKEKPRFRRSDNQGRPKAEGDAPVITYCPGFEPDVDLPSAFMLIDDDNPEATLGVICKHCKHSRSDHGLDRKKMFKSTMKIRPRSRMENPPKE